MGSDLVIYTGAKKTAKNWTARKRRKRCERAAEKFFEKSWKKLLTKASLCGNIDFRRHERRHGPWKLNNDLGTRDFFEKFWKRKNYSLTSMRWISTEKTSRSEKDRNYAKRKLKEQKQALRLVITTSVVLIQILESLILAQDERWRRA